MKELQTGILNLLSLSGTTRKLKDPGNTWAQQSIVILTHWALWEKNLYLFGGQMKLKNQFLITNSVERWSLQGGPWRSAAPLPMPLAYHSVVRMKGRLYVLGGRTPQVIYQNSANMSSLWYNLQIYCTSHENVKLMVQITIIWKIKTSGDHSNALFIAFSLSL